VANSIAQPLSPRKAQSSPVVVELMREVLPPRMLALQTSSRRVTANCTEPCCNATAGAANSAAACSICRFTTFSFEVIWEATQKKI
jgi:hypothetical protein